MNIVALIACAVVVVIKTPGALKGRGRVSYAAFVMLGAALLLTVPAVYLTVDGWMGGRNFANVLIRVAVFGVASAMAVSPSGGSMCAAPALLPRSSEIVAGAHSGRHVVRRSEGRAACVERDDRML